MLRQRRNMLQKRKDMAMMARKDKVTQQKEKKKQSIDIAYSPWQTPPEDIMERILQLVDFDDQRSLGQISKSWRSIVFQKFKSGVCRQLPWLILPESPNFRGNKHMSFLSFPENRLSKGKVVNLKLPKKLQGGWIFGSSKGWLIIIKEKGLRSEMCLVNPISRAIRRLPPLTTIPTFAKYVKNWEWESFGAKGLCSRIIISSTSDGLNSSSDFIVAALFEDYPDSNLLCLCRPGDEKWSVFPELYQYYINDILFSSGMLYAVVFSKEIDGGVSPTRTLDFAFHDAQDLKMKLVFDKKRAYENEETVTEHREYKRLFRDKDSRLLESTSKEVLLIQQNNEYVVETENDEEPDFKAARPRTQNFITYKTDPEHNKLHMMRSLGDQLLFLGNDCSFSLPASNIKEVENNCIYFATNTYWEMRWISKDIYWDMKWLPKTYVSDEFGKFCLSDQRIERANEEPFQDMKMSVKYQPSWFTPAL